MSRTWKPRNAGTKQGPLAVTAESDGWPPGSTPIRLLPGMRCYFLYDTEWHPAVVIQATQLMAAVCPVHHEMDVGDLGRVQMPDGKDAIAVSPARIRVALEHDSHEAWKV